ncbi:MAG: serine hydrolase [bacterium]
MRNRFLRHGAITVLLAVAAFVQAGCGGSGDSSPIPTTPTPAAVSSVAISAPTTSMTLGATSTFTATVKDASGNTLTGRAVSWSSSADAVATVSQSGVVTAVAAGVATIQATSEGKSGQSIVTVIPPVASVVMAQDSINVQYGGTATLAATARDAAGVALTGRTIGWQSSDPTVATVSLAGVVSAVLPGVVTITASSEGKQATMKVRIVAADISRIIDSVRQVFNLPALGGAIVTRSGGMIAVGVGGVRRWGTNTPVTLDDKWHLGSDTKTMTGLLAAITVKAGRVAWTDRMTARYPELAPIARPEFATLTLRDLANMQSGIIGNPGFTPTGTAAQQRIAVDSWAVQQPAVSAYGTHYYSNVNYQILGEILGRAWGTGYEQALRDRLWTPLGITSGGFGPTTAVGASNQPVGHAPNGTGWTVCEACDNSWATGSGMVHMSLADWSKVLQEVLRADAGQSALLSQAEARVLTTGVSVISPAQSYGIGWVVNTSGQRYVAHDGTNNRNRARASVFLDTGVAFLLTTNAGDPAVDGGVPNAALNALGPRLQTFWQTGK